MIENEHTKALNTLITRAVTERRQAAESGDLPAVLKAQETIDVLERAEAHERELAPKRSSTATKSIRNY